LSQTPRQCWTLTRLGFPTRAMMTISKGRPRQGTERHRIADATRWGGSHRANRATISAIHRLPFAGAEIALYIDFMPRPPAR
jgi:hypothetical protein